MCGFVSLSHCSTNLPSGDQVDGLPLHINRRAAAACMPLPKNNTSANVIAGAMPGTHVWQTNGWFDRARDSSVRVRWRVACTLLSIDT